MEIVYSCMEAPVAVPVSYVKGGIAAFFHANAELIWKLMGW
jgi:hypothetical protein